ncbi:transmembrane protein 107-like [Argonauta hians]
MQRLSVIIPVRFLLLVSHFITVVMVMLSKDNNIIPSLPVPYTPEEYDSKRTQLTVALGLSFGMLAIEFLGFFSGSSMFSVSQSTFSALFHGFGAVFSSLFIVQSGQMHFYWYIFAVFCTLPAITELVTVIGVHCFHKGLH